MVILDTTILAYAVGDAHPLQEGSTRVLAAHRDGSLRATTTAEVIQAFAHIYARRRTREEPARLAGFYLDALDPVTATAADTGRPHAARSGPRRVAARSPRGSHRSPTRTSPA